MKSLIDKYLSKIALVLFVMLTGCASYYHNGPLAFYDPAGGYRFANVKMGESNSENLFVILTFSGGGTRAAALSYGVMEKLRNTKIYWDGKERRLLDEVDVISSVSGGSFTAAYYGLFREELFDPQKFEKEFLYRNIQGELISSLFNPVNWYRLASSTFGRVELAAEFYNQEIFRERRFVDLIKESRRPFIMLNATDISVGLPFSFTQDQFDLMCSDLAGVRIATAVAASSNFPIAFNTLALKNFAGTCGYREGSWVQNAMQDARVNLDRYKRARAARSYYLDHREYVHLLDGGISDNIGLKGPLVALQSNDTGLNLVTKINLRDIKKIVVIIVDAHTFGQHEFDKTNIGPSLFETIDAIASIPMSNQSDATIREFFNLVSSIGKDSESYRACAMVLESSCPAAKMPALPEDVRFDGIHVNFDLIKNEKDREYFLGLPTTFYLPKEAIDKLRAVGQLLVAESPEFQRLCAELKCHE